MEVVISVFIMVPVLVMVLSVFLGIVRGATEAWEETRAVAAGQRLMDNIRRMKWDELTPNTGGMISTSDANIGLDPSESVPDNCDDIDDWNGFSAPDPLPAYARYNRSVRVQFVTIDSVDHEVIVSGVKTNFKRVIVTVTGLNGKPVVISSVFTNSLP